MEELAYDEWYAEVSAALPALFEPVRSGHVTPEVVVGLWRLLRIAPSGLRGKYEEVSEREILHEADSCIRPSALLAVPDPDTPDREACRIIGGLLRAAENQYLEAETGRSVDPEEWIVSAGGKSFFLIPAPRRSSKASPVDKAKDQRPFSRRGVTHMRVLRCDARGHQIFLKDHRELGRGLAEFSFSATTFSEVKFPEADGVRDGCFLVAGVEGPTETMVRQQLAEAGQNNSFAHVFPELTIDPAMRSVISDELLALSERTLPSPVIVVGGSFHDEVAGAFTNRGYVYSGSGKPLFEYRKIVVYSDPDKRHEDIQPGRSIPVMVTAIGLIAFPICKDLCHSHDTPFSELDVDFMLTPSCGDAKTIREHVGAAQRLHDRFSSRPFVAQQSYPPRDDDVIGYVLPATGGIRGLVEKDTFVQQHFSIRAVT
ncbi:hypothetical protein [Bosea lathyri]|uniref:Uncharacterized protein n=1 Tax=Bosea lathyri TaxID=1036778 RepID=A0A1H6BSV7_9HYPH|nr:hypothetical protein [Bosea lathyri]SEG63720.1 hypothetical protein SAMN04488115_10827 [Bosea lathyri]